MKWGSEIWEDWGESSRKENAYKCPLVWKHWIQGQGQPEGYVGRMVGMVMSRVYVCPLTWSVG